MNMLFFFQIYSFDFVFPIITTFISLLFFLGVSEQWIRKKRSHQIIWALALFFFVITAGCEALSYLLGTWDVFVYKIYYLLAAFQVAVLGAGVLYLLASRETINNNNTWLLAIVFGTIWFILGIIFFLTKNNFIFLPVVFIGLIFTILGIIQIINKLIKDSYFFNLTGIRFSHLFIVSIFIIFSLMLFLSSNTNVNEINLTLGHEVGGNGYLYTDGSTADIRSFSPLFTIIGTIALVFGPVYSYILWQISIKKDQGSFSIKSGIFNIYIAVGALIFALGGVASRLNLNLLYITEVISILLMYFGFLESDKITLKKVFSTLTLGLFKDKNLVDTT